MRFLPLGILLILLASCLDEPDCISTASNKVAISLRRIAEDSARTVKFDRILVSGTDSVFYESDSLSFLHLPVNPATTETTFRFYYELKMDSLVLSYTRETKVVSPQCGAFNYFQELSVVSTSFGQVIVDNSQLSISGTANLTIKL